MLSYEAKETLQMELRGWTFRSVQFSCSVMFYSLRPHEPQHARPPCPSPTPRVHLNPCLLIQWCHLTISSSVVPFSSCLLSLPASGSFLMSWLFAQFSSVQSLSCVRLFVTPWTAALQAFLSITNSEEFIQTHTLSRWCHPTISSFVVPFSSCPQSFPASGSFPMSQLFTSGGQSIGSSASTTVFPMNAQDWSPLGGTGWISLQPRDSQESSPIPQFKSSNSSVLIFLYSPTLTSIHDCWKNRSFD